LKHSSAPSTVQIFGPTLVVSPSQQSPVRGALAWWHLLSLDAPTVAAVWIVFVARSTKAHISPNNCAAMFVAVWMLYAGDRLLDARAMEDDPRNLSLEERHRFHARHRDRFLFGIVAAAAALMFLLRRMDATTLHRYSLLTAALGTWLLLVHAMPRAVSAHRLPKELIVGLFFSAAVFIPALGLQPARSIELAPAAVLFAATCTLNCLFIYAWEHPILRATRRSQAAELSERWGSDATTHRTTLWGVHHLITIAACVILLGVLAATALPFGKVNLACAFSAAGLLALHHWREKMSPLNLRAASDLALLSPLLLVWTRFAH
jgi:hypothetical protein